MDEGQTGFLRGQWKRDGFLVLCGHMILGVAFIYASIDKIIHYNATSAFIGKDKNNEN